MNTRQPLLLAFAFAFAFFILAPAFLGKPFPAYDLMHWADVLDILTPLVVIPLYWLLFAGSGLPRRHLRPTLAFVVLAALWTLGQGMHLSANSINNLLGGGSTDLHNLVHFYDEVLSHYLWHIGIVGLSVVILTTRQEGESGGAPVRWAIIVPSAILYGFAFFAAVIEGGTVPFGLPAAILIVLALLLARRAGLQSESLTAFFFTGYVVALVFFIVWFIWQGGLPPFSDVGII
jgi:hypothetical protein